MFPFLQAFGLHTSRIGDAREHFKQSLLPMLLAFAMQRLGL
jgi:hypothetical protein